MYWVYLGAFALFLIIEASTYNLVTIWMAIGALVAGIYAYIFPTQILPQLFIFVVVSIALLALTKPIMKKIKPTFQHTNADRIIGTYGFVVEEINNDAGKGQVKVSGQIWSAKSMNNVIINENKKVKIQKIEGVKLFVSEDA